MYSKTTDKFFSQPPKLTIEEEAGKLAKLFYNELFDISITYRQECGFFFRGFEYHAGGLRTMLKAIFDNDGFDNFKRLFLLIKLTQDLFDFLTCWESKRFKSLLHEFMNNHNLLNDMSAPALLTIIEKMPYLFNFRLYFVGGCHMLYNSKRYFAQMHVHYDDFIKRNPHYEHNNRQYTLDELVGDFIDAHDNAPCHLAKIGKMPLIVRPRDELDVPESVIDMHNLL